MRYLDKLDTPLGTLQIEATESGLCGICFPSRAATQGPSPGKNRVITLTKRELSAYFAGELTHFQSPRLARHPISGISMAGPSGSTLWQDRDLRRCCQSYRQTALVSAVGVQWGKTPSHHRALSPRHRQ